MRLANETITVLNTALDEETGYDVLHSTVIRGVTWFAVVKSTVSSTGLLAANQYTIRIPVGADFSGKQYVDPVDYKDSETQFTFRNGDLILRGEAEVAKAMTPAALKAEYGEVVTIMGATDNRRAPRAPHWKVVGA